MRFIGETSFASGRWVGVEMTGRDGTGADVGFEKGKNDGSVNGTAYFVCAPNHGIFVRPNVVRLL